MSQMRFKCIQGYHVHFLSLAIVAMVSRGGRRHFWALSKPLLGCRVLVCRHIFRPKQFQMHPSMSRVGC